MKSADAANLIWLFKNGCSVCCSSAADEVRIRPILAFTFAIFRFRWLYSVLALVPLPRCVLDGQDFAQLPQTCLDAVGSACTCVFF